MSTRRFFICWKSNWQGDGWKPVAGPFRSRKEAEAHPLARGYHPRTALGGIDIASEQHARVFSRTELTRKYGFRRGAEGDEDIYAFIADFQASQE